MSIWRNLSLVFVIFSSLTIPASAATWSGNAFFTNKWSAIDNWVGFNVANTANEDAIFSLGGPAARTTPDVDKTFAVRDLQFLDQTNGTAARAFTLAGSGRIDVHRRLLSHSKTSQTINSRVRTSGSSVSIENFIWQQPQNRYGKLTFNGGVSLDASSTLVAPGPNGIAFKGVVSGGGRLSIGGIGTTTLSAKNTFTGDLSIAGNLLLTGKGRLADKVDVSVAEESVFRVEVPDAINSLEGNGNVELNGPGAMLVVGNYAGFGAVGNGDFSGVISGDGRLVKRGVDGTLELSGINTHTGGTLVEEGTLRVFGAASGTGLGNTEVRSGAVLEGHGVLAGITTINAGGFLKPDPFYDFGFANLTLLDGSTTSLDVYVAHSPSGDNRFLQPTTLEVSGAARLSGTLQLAHQCRRCDDPTASFQLGDRFNLIDARRVLDTFDAVHGLSIGDERSLAIVYANSLVDAVVAIPGDTDLDGQVSFSDFLALASNFGSGSIWAEGDFDGNGLVDFPDFLKLAANFGRREIAFATAVPEPDASVFLGLGSVALLICTRRTRGRAVTEQQ